MEKETIETVEESIRVLERIIRSAKQHNPERVTDHERHLLVLKARLERLEIEKQESSNHSPEAPRGAATQRAAVARPQVESVMKRVDRSHVPKQE